MARDEFSECLHRIWEGVRNASESFAVWSTLNSEESAQKWLAAMNYVPGFFVAADYALFTLVIVALAYPFDQDERSATFLAAYRLATQFRENSDGPIREAKRILQPHRQTVAKVLRIRHKLAHHDLKVRATADLENVNLGRNEVTNLIDASYSAINALSHPLDRNTFMGNTKEHVRHTKQLLEVLREHHERMVEEH
jgi:AbiU2